MNANDVIRIGRSRKLQVLEAASRPCLDSRFDLGELDNEDGVLAHAQTISTTKPTCVKMLMSCLAIATPTSEDSTHMGTTRITANGKDQLS